MTRAGGSTASGDPSDLALYKVRDRVGGRAIRRGVVGRGRSSAQRGAAADSRPPQGQRRGDGRPSRSTSWRSTRSFAVCGQARHRLSRGADGLAPIAAGGPRRTVPDPAWQSRRSCRPSAARQRKVALSYTGRGAAYASSKLALVTLAHEWADRVAASGGADVYDLVLVAGTGLGRDMRPHEYWPRRVMPVMSVLPGRRPRGGPRALVALPWARPPRPARRVRRDGTVTRAEPVTFDRPRRRALWEW